MSGGLTREVARIEFSDGRVEVIGVEGDMHNELVVRVGLEDAEQIRVDRAGILLVRREAKQP